MTSQETVQGVGDDARIAGLVQAYLEADYRWEHQGQWHHLRIGQPAPAIDDAFMDATCFGLVSAWNPQSTCRPEAENRVADLALHAQLLKADVVCRPSFASASDRSWREPGWLTIDIPEKTFDGIARRFSQTGTLWWKRGEPVRLRMYRRAPGLACEAAAAHAFVDWVGTTY